MLAEKTTLKRPVWRFVLAIVVVASGLACFILGCVSALILSRGE